MCERWGPPPDRTPSDRSSPPDRSPSDRALSYRSLSESDANTSPVRPALQDPAGSGGAAAGVAATAAGPPGPANPLGVHARLRTRALSLILRASNLARPNVAAKGDDLFLSYDIIERYRGWYPRNNIISSTYGAVRLTSTPVKNRPSRSVYDVPHLTVTLLCRPHSPLEKWPALPHLMRTRRRFRAPS